MEVKIMTENQMLERIVINPKVKVGKPVIKGTRLSVEYILGLLAQGATFDEILQEYDGLTSEDIQACLLCLEQLHFRLAMSAKWFHQVF